jgi:Uncharacterized conserved protein
MENIKEMIDVNTIVGDPVETADGNVIIPISKVLLALWQEAVNTGMGAKTRSRAGVA